MTQPSVAARRFYHAFYRWNVLLSSNARSRHPRLSQLSGSYIRLNERHRSERHRSRKHTSPTHSSLTLRPGFLEDRRLASQGEQTSLAPSLRDGSPSRQIPRNWLDDSPLNSTDKPFDTFTVWEEVVRYRSSAGIMIQTAVPAEQIEWLQREYGTKLEQMVPKTLPRSGSAATVELGDTVVFMKALREQVMFEGWAMPVRSVLVSGSLEEVAQLTSRLRVQDVPLKEDEAVLSDQRQPSAAPEKPAVGGKQAWGLSSRRLAQNKSKQSQQPQNDTGSPLKATLSPKLPPSLNRSYEKQATPSWLLVPPKALEDFPSHTLQPLLPTLRRRAADSSTMSVEVVIPANEHWDAEVMELLQRHQQGIEMELLGAFSFAVQQTGEISWRRSIVAKGGVQGVQKAVGEILETPAKVLKKMNAGTNPISPTPVVEGTHVHLKDRIYTNQEEAAHTPNASDSSAPNPPSSTHKIPQKRSSQKDSDIKQLFRVVFAVPHILSDHAVSQTLKKEVPDATFEFDKPKQDHFFPPSGSTSKPNERFIAVNGHLHLLFVAWKALQQSTAQALATDGIVMDGEASWHLVRIVEDKWNAVRAWRKAETQLPLSVHEVVAIPDGKRPSVLSEWARYWRDGNCIVRPISTNGEESVEIRGYDTENVELVKSWILQLVNDTPEAQVGRDSKDPVDSNVVVGSGALTDQALNEQSIQIDGVDLSAEEKALGYTLWIRLAVPAQKTDYILANSRHIWDSEKCYVKKVDGGETSGHDTRGDLILLGPTKLSIERATAMIRDLAKKAGNRAPALARKAPAPRVLKPAYSRVTVPSDLVGYLVVRNILLRRRYGCAIVDEAPDDLGRNGRKSLTIWGPNRDKVDQAKDFVKEFLGARSRDNEDSRDPLTLINVEEEGFDRHGMALIRLIAREEARVNRQITSDLHVFAVCTIPDEVVYRLPSLIMPLFSETRCVLQLNDAFGLPQEMKPAGRGQTRITLWALTEESVKDGIHYVEDVTRKMFEGRGLAKGGKIGVNVLEHGVSDTPYRQADTAKHTSLDRASDVEQKNPASTTDPDGYMPIEEAEQDAPPSPDINEQYFEQAAKTGHQLSDHEQGGSEVASATPESEDEFLFPEFTSEVELLPIDEQYDGATNKTSPPTRPRPSLSVNNPRHEWGLQQRAYSTSTTSKRSQHTVSSVNEDADQEELETDDSAISSEQLAEDLKRTLRTLTHPVVLVTSRVRESTGDASNTSTDDPLRGVTVSSLNTITLTPTPMVSFNLRVPSRSWDAIKSSGRFAAYFLAATPEGAVIAHAFTQPYERSEEPFLRLMRLGVQVFEDSSTASDSVAQPKPPLIHWPGAIIARVTASVLPDKCVHVGDHVVVIAEVTGVDLASSDERGTSKTADEAVGLAYAMRGFRGVAEEIQPLQLPELDDTSAAAAENDATNSSQTNGTGPNRHASRSGAARPSLKSHYSTLARTKRNGCCTPRFIRTTPENAPGNHQTQNQDTDPSTQVTDPELLSTTVGDFLGTANNFVRPPRIRSLVDAQKEAQKASRALEQALANGSLTPEESSRLENIVTRNERRVAKTLALRSANDLRAMLDKGQVDFKRAQWLESSIEKGQAILLDEARQVRQMLEEKSISSEQFKVVRAKLEEQNQILTAEATRLRQMVDEESEGGGRGSDRGDFDGFQGNV